MYDIASDLGKSHQPTWTSNVALRLVTISEGGRRMPRSAAVMGAEWNREIAVYSRCTRPSSCPEAVKHWAPLGIEEVLCAF